MKAIENYSGKEVSYETERITTSIKSYKNGQRRRAMVKRYIVDNLLVMDAKDFLSHYTKI